LRFDRGRLIYLESNHKGCWIELTESFDIEIKVLDIIVDSPYDDFFIVRALIMDESGGILRFISRLRRHPYIGGVRQIFLSDNSYGIYDLYIRKHRSTPEVIFEFKGTVLDHYIRNGVECWKLIIPSDIEGFRSRVNELFNVMKYMESSLYSVKDDLYNPELSDRELESLYLAYVYGYYDYPKKVKAKHLARLLNLNTATFLYHLRKAEKKIISRYISRIMKMKPFDQIH
jgi:predicted DNA binding protein